MNEAGKINDEPSLKLFAQKKHSVAVQQLSTLNCQLVKSPASALPPTPSRGLQ